ncbi:PLP-dependent transferase [Piscinibacter terrae]|uniref:Cystathionine beta-lyase n=1 Tax=Piscinibacter terrae TaxID=2496871 RepID=A0A3N7JSH2_9BURK|nr:PLP-dependent transferase [Albitalea terrae]RQP23919.1 cystathionine beta-lyase [Albitalea terrae]
MTERSTTLIHHPYTPPAGFNAPQPGVFKASTVIFANTAAMRARDWREKLGYTYGLHGTPTTFTLEERIATLEGGTRCLLTPSGLAAIGLIDFALLRTGDEVLIPSNAYNPGKELARHELAGWGIGLRLYDCMNPQSLIDGITPATKLIWLEAPGSVTMEFPDLAALLKIARDRKVVTALDNTWGSGIAFNPFEIAPGLGVDISMHALTKFPSGGGDVLMGSVTTRDDDLHTRLKLTHMRTGLGVGANDAEAVLRGLPTLVMRYDAQDRSARAIAQWCASRPEVSQVLHPALAGSPGHEHWKASCKAAAGIFSIVIDERYGSTQVDAFVDALKLFKIGYSWAGPVSLVVPYDLKAIRPREEWKGTLVRLCIGLEATQDLIDDLDQALRALH